MNSDTVSLAGTPLQQVPTALRTLIDGVGNALARCVSEAELLADVRPLLADLVRCDDWLPAAWARPQALGYCQYPLYIDPDGRFSVVSFVWAPDAATPIHDHTVWGAVGMLRGSEAGQQFTLDEAGVPFAAGAAQQLMPGDVELVSPRLGDIHRVSNASADTVSISIHVYGADIGTVQRHVYLPDGTRKPFVSGYSTPVLT